MVSYVFFMSVAQILDDQPELSCTVTERDLNLSEMEILRQPPLNSLANDAGGDPTQEAAGDPR